MTQEPIFENKSSTSSCQIAREKIKESNGTNENMELHRNQRMRKEKSFGSDYTVYLVDGKRTKFFNKILILLHIEDDLKMFEETMSSRDATFW